MTEQLTLFPCPIEWRRLAFTRIRASVGDYEVDIWYDEFEKWQWTAREDTRIKARGTAANEQQAKKYALEKVQAMTEKAFQRQAGGSCARYSRAKKRPPMRGRCTGGTKTELAHKIRLFGVADNSKWKGAGL